MCSMEKKNKLPLILSVAAGILVLVIVLFVLPPRCQTAKPTGSYQLETVERGTVVASIKASGVIESDDEITLRSPERGILKKVYKSAGSMAHKGELLLELDEKSILEDIERAENQLTIKRNSLEKMKLNAQSTQLSLDQNEMAKRMRINSLQSTLSTQKKMLDEGKIDESRVRRTQQEIENAEADLQTQIERNAIRIQQMDADERGILLQIHNQEKALREKQQLLQKLKINAPADGVILAINSNEGQRIESNAMLLRMSDLSSYKVVAWTNEKFARYIKTGNRVLVNAGNATLEGRVGEITPMVDDEMIHFNVYLNDKQHAGLTVNQSVSVEVISRQQNNVLRIPKHPYYEKNNRHFLYVVDGKHAEKREVIFGTLGNEWCEIVSGLNEGDQLLAGTPLTAESRDRISLKRKYLK